jgi:hypothetical protein
MPAEMSAAARPVCSMRGIRGAAAAGGAGAGSIVPGASGASAASADAAPPVVGAPARGPDTGAFTSP